MQKHTVFEGIIERGMVGIVRAPSAQAAVQIAEACIAGGITALEVAFTTPDTLGVLRTLRERHGHDVLLGAGTVLDTETARAAILAGAQFIISPGVNVETIALCQRYQVLAMPGAMTPTEIVTALQAGADIVKVFPAEMFGPAYIKALRAPLPQAPLMPTGGVTVENLQEWFASGAVAVGIGSSLSGPGATGDYAAVTARAQAFVAKMALVRTARSSG
ncbi:MULTISPECIES: bifunctional 2-keto-4-hydroxyglutarate aldolase/2-keto-3-deoxy-6-phosphogluconate aldolase [unclassified Janthinobacterium]|uniref:bifunctional 2-keto-4-hydroxyglutarate aldolase/2-keto-3-deoxy-6-phosphogluconate aldolase n=1 Tax=unclassified Janthinobacterium TaxID=2610881 RepID=UPI000C70BE65|nr:MULTISPECIES: bifunctional 2-keto-4-hydroxyglutarate aldolase/2-keto-3-deoxy-6-phosphogluconate aldolase [unclassified Janthinobacterium]PKV46679.1 2-dehydro-3-deoxyphosphogluconate aldolase/(4S)-4-hydroxy-2-oxoglutarate aldolase [Janthinobacterium sp. 61]TDY33065.1 2-dehydro-3-deoxyphosphogluconate aldolase/(4S)-4-hydroxy-2-oxoglutarate aldolase [Janthinobacterium sp. 75]